MAVQTCADCKEPLTGGKLTERGMVCARCAERPYDPRVDERRLRTSRSDRQSRDGQRDMRQGKPV
jgi:recombinational DNA repair protein (RecF pathway)